MYTLTCRICGKQFESNHPNRVYCKGPHYFSCPVCGKKFCIDKNKAYYEGKQGRACCCRVCTRAFVESNLSDEQKQHRKQARITTMQEKYGVVNPGQMQSVLEKRKQTNLKKFGTEYANQSEQIKQKTRETNLKKYGVTCTLQADCIKEKAKETLVRKYGVDHISKTEYFKEKLKQTSQEKYGTDYPIASKQVRDKIHATTLKHYGVENPFYSPELQAKAVETKLQKYGHLGPTKEQLKNAFNENYGVDWYTQTQEYRDKVHATSLRKYGMDYFQSSDSVKQARIDTCMQKYGVDNVRKAKEIKAKMRQTFIERYGYDSPSKVPEIRRKQVANARTSKLEKRVAALLDSYNIVYTTQFVVSKNSHIHAFDFYIPQYKILLDADGVYYHSYISDPDGKFVGDDYDEVRMYLVPNDHTFILAVEGQEDKAVKHVYDIIKSMDANVFDYETELFKWCRLIGFPYAQYSDKRMNQDWLSLRRYENDKYVPQCKLGMSIVKNFHKSIYDAKVGKGVSPKEAWHDDAKLKKVIANRLIYQNTVDPNKVLQGFNISKIAPTVSLFNPVLARYLTLKYLSEYTHVFDPFSGFSGRMLGVASTGKQYCGQDISSAHVQESSSIVEFLSLQSCCSVSCKDVLQSSGTYECLLTCPPYSSKETYGSETEFKSCDEWIDECTQRFSCKAYVFVVDSTEKYKQYVTETLHNSSHFSKSKEYVVVIK